jgi:thiol:disulfide interchange protein DsbC
MNVELLAGEKQDTSKDVYRDLKVAVKQFFPDIEPDKISPSPVSGLVEVVIGPRLFYFSEDGKFLVNGNIIDVQNKEDVTEPKTAEARKGALDNLGEDEMVIFAPKETKHTVTVFTDIDCGYCRKLHDQMGEYNDLGISVRYLLYPRSQIGSPSYNKAVNVWCAKDKKQALTDAKSGVSVDAKECPNPVSNNMRFGRMMGVNGTPAIVLSNGQMVRGYLPPKALIKRLESNGS